MKIWVALTHIGPFISALHSAHSVHEQQHPPLLFVGEPHPRLDRTGRSSVYLGREQG